MISQVKESGYGMKVEETRSSGNYGKTVGKPKLSEAGEAYYKELKDKYSNMEFVLVSKDMKEYAKSQAGNFANANKMVVLIDEEKIERMATDTEYRKQYENLIESAKNQLPQLAQGIQESGTSVKGFGMQINDNGTASYFAVIDKSLSAQKERIEEKREEHRKEVKAEEKKQLKKAQEERIKNKSDNETVEIRANSIEELIQKLKDYNYARMSDNILTDDEKMVGQGFDYSV